MITAGQVRAARALVGMGQKDLAQIAGVSPATLRRIESDEVGPERSGAGSVNSIRLALEGAGVTFVSKGSIADGTGVSVRDP